MRWDVRRQRCDTAIADDPGFGDQPQYGREMAETGEGGGFVDKTGGFALDRIDRSGRDNDSRLPGTRSDAT